MSSEPVVRELPPIRASMIDVKPVEDGRPSAANPANSDKEEDTAAAAAAECVTTPRSEEHVLKPAVVCPPAPRKPRPVKRKFAAPSRGFYPVPDDLTSVFLPFSCPASKKIRVA